MRMISDALQAIYEQNKAARFVAELSQEEQATIKNLACSFFEKQGHSPRNAERFAATLLGEKMYTFKDFVEIVRRT